MTTTDYPIRDASGELQAYHVRRDFLDGDGKPAKDYRWELPDGSSRLGRPAASLPCYRTETIAAVPLEEVVLVTEGERAADAVAATGLPVIATVTGASSCPTPEALRPIAAGRRFAVWPDDDDSDAGVRHANAVAAALLQAGALEVEIIPVLGRGGGWDAADELDGLDPDAAREHVEARRAVAIAYDPTPAPSAAPTRPVVALPGPGAGNRYAELVSDLDGRSRGPVTERGRMAHCPGPTHANGDRHPSLSWQEADAADGRRLVLHCFAGCTVDAILDTLGYTKADLYEPRPDRFVPSAVPDPLATSRRPAGGMLARSAVEVAEEPDDEADRWLVEGLIRPGAYGILAGYEGEGKSYIRTQVAIGCAAPTGPLFGRFPVPAPVAVLVVDGENGTREERRRDRGYLEDLEPATVEELRSRYFRLGRDEASLSLRRPEDLALIAAEADALRGRSGCDEVLLVLDSADSLYGPVLHGEAVGPFNDAIRSLRDGRPWLAVLLVAHMTKRNHDARRAHLERALEDVVGNVTRQADAVFLIERKGDERIAFRTRKRVPHSDLILGREPEGVWWSVVADGTAGEPFRKLPPAELLAYIDGDGGPQVTANAVKARFGVGRETARRALDDLVTAGVLDTTQPRIPFRSNYYWRRGTL